MNSKWMRAFSTPNLPLGKNGERVTGSAEHIALSKEAAKEGMVLLKNEGHRLPLKGYHRIALFGKASIDYVKGGGGSGDVTCAYVKNLCEGLEEEENIRVIVETAPVNETSYSIFTDAFKANYRAYMSNLQEKNPGVEIYTDFYCYGNDQFGDADHLNKKGCKAFSKYIREKYAEVFTN